MVVLLLKICHQQQEQITQQQEQIHLLKEKVQGLKDEIARLKNQKPKPTIKPSSLGNPPKTNDEQSGDPKGKRPGSSKRKKKLKIDKTIKVAPEDIPEGSRFKGYEDFTIQELVIKPYNTLYRLERWETPDGGTLQGTLPPGVNEGHFGPNLISFIIYQYHHAHVTQPLIWEQLVEFGIDISSGKVNSIITEGKDRYHKEKDEILKVGLEVSKYFHTDDTGARHKGKNGYCTHIGNAWFAWFESTSSKSRINFLQILRGCHTDYVLNSDALEYMKQQKLPQDTLRIIEEYLGEEFCDKWAWESFLGENNIIAKHHYRIATEGALLGSVIHHGIHPEAVIISDDAGQFNVLAHALCWIHTERSIQKLVGFNDDQTAALENKRKEIWDFYSELKTYKQTPTSEKKAELDKKFDDIFKDKTCFATLNQALKRIHKNKSELLLVLERPDIPLHNNPSEQDIREYVKKRKISGSSRSNDGRRCRDTFASIKKTCRKLGISFWQYLQDRTSGLYIIPLLPELIRQRAMEAYSESGN